MPREQSPDERIRNPGTFSADDDEALEADITHAGASANDENADVDAVEDDEGEDGMIDEVEDEDSQPLP